MRIGIRVLAAMLLLTPSACAPRAAIDPGLDPVSLAPPAHVEDGAGPLDAQVDDRAGRWTTRELTASNGFLKITLKIPTAPAGAKPLVINPNVDEEALLTAGILVAQYQTDWGVVPGPKGEQAGESATANVVGSWMLASPRVGIVGRKYVGFIDANARRVVSKVIDTIVAATEVDRTRIGISGSSTNGFIVLEALLAEPRLTAAVARSACGDYRSFLKSSSLAVNDDPNWLVDGRLVLDADYDAELAAREPLHHAGEYPPRPLLLLNGSADAAIPMACVEPTVTVFTRVYRERRMAARFSSVVYEGAGHDLGERAAVDELAWWHRWFGAR